MFVCLFVCPCLCYSLATWGPRTASHLSVLSPAPSRGGSPHESLSSAKDFPRTITPAPPPKRVKPSVKQALVAGAERLLASLSQQDGGRRKKKRVSADEVEIRVRSILGLAKLAVSLHQSVSGYQLALQGLRLLQVLEEGEWADEEEEEEGEGTKQEVLSGRGISGGEGVRLLHELDLHLWLECRHWMARSVVGLEGGPPGGGGLLLEVGEHCEECGQLGGVEMVAGMECAAAEHALCLLPCQLQAAQQHSQVSPGKKFFFCRVKFLV